MNELNANTLIIAILSSSLLAAALTSLATGLFNIYIKGKEYENKYFEEIIKRRLEVYEHLEVFLSLLKTSSVDSDGRPYHLIFAYGEDKFYEFQQHFHYAISKSVWLDARTKDVLQQFTILFYELSDRYDLEKEHLEAGKHCYERVVELREKLEKSFSDDLRKLHKVKRFLKNKPETEGYRLLNVRTQQGREELRNQPPLENPEK
jgi:hypothetical protein